ncbi:glycosyltransferase [Rhodococcus sp. WAY2]|uniref:glycosyltransferase n=1 Tax=Rhodococcus sp. WAY2 TaxID=2663121 RepID=UPI001358B212
MSDTSAEVVPSRIAADRGSNSSHSYSAVVLYYKLGSSVADTIDALMNQTHPPSNVIVVDNASKDGVLATVASRRRDLTVLELDENRGYAGGMNAGAKAIGDSTPLTLFLTHEVVLDPNCLRNLTRGMSAGKHTLVGPVLTRGTTGKVWSKGGVFTRWGGVKHILDDRSQPEVQWIDGACLLVDTAKFRDIRGFDEDYFLYWEDVDVSARLRTQGTIGCVDTARASQETATTPIYFQIRNQILFWRKRGKWVPASLAAAAALAKIFIRDIPRWRIKVIEARVRGLIDGLTGELNLDLASLREV